MKLRLRSFETKETLKVEVPNHCSLQHLSELVSQKLPSLSFRSIYFSLNQKDELITSSPEESIQSVGITSGDLIYFTTNLNGFSIIPQIPSVTPSAPDSKQPQNSQTLTSDSGNQNEKLNSEKGKEVDFGNPSSEDSTETMEIDNNQNERLKSEKGKEVDFGNPSSEDSTETMEIDNDRSSVSDVGKSFSVPGFLRKVFTEEVGNDGGINHKLLRIAVSAVLLESGFVEIDPTTYLLKGLNVDVKKDCYTLPNIINNADNIETVNIKFQNLGKYCKVYGFLINGTRVHSVLLDEDRLVPFLNLVWANCGQVVEIMEENNRIFNVQPENEVFEFWRKVKDGLALPLMIDLCDKAGLEPPPCFMRLPTELKLIILEYISGVDIAKVSCVCAELRYLASSDDLWKLKYIEQFGNVEGSESGRTFKERFAKTWVDKKKRKIANRSAFRIMRRNPIGYLPFGFGNVPRIIGGDYDLFPNLGPFGLPRPGGPRLRNVRPDCNLDGLDL